jgi:beta-N-acetylhexosaminidase
MSDQLNRDAAGALIVGFTPFAATIAADADPVMSAHIVFSGYDDAPARLGGSLPCVGG